MQTGKMERQFMKVLRIPLIALVRFAIAAALIQCSIAQPVWGPKSIALRHNRQLAPDGSWSYNGDFEAKIQVNGAQSVNLLRPDGGVTELATYGDPTWWTAREDADLPIFQSSFPDGVYVFRATFPGPVVSHAAVDTRIIPMPGEYPEFSGITAEAQWPANTPLVLRWQQWTLNRQGNDVMLFVDNILDGNNQPDYVIPVPPPATNHVVPESALPNNSRFHTWVHFANWSTNSEVNKQTASHVEFQTGTPRAIQGHDVDLMQYWMPSQHGDWYRYNFEAEVDSLGANRATVTTPIKPGFPAGETLALHNEGITGWQEWWLDVGADSAAALSSRFPDGTYTYTLWFPDGSHTNASCEVGATWPTSFPQPSSPTPPTESTVSPYTALTISWAPWIHTNAPDETKIGVSVEQLGGENELFEANLPGNATSCTIPPGTFQPGGRYFVTIQFETIFSDGNDKDKSLILQYSTSPYIPPASVRTLPTGNLRFQASSLPGSVLNIQSSTNLSNWDTIATLTNVSGFVWFTNTSSSVERCFFRLKLQDSSIPTAPGDNFASSTINTNKWGSEVILGLGGQLVQTNRPPGDLQRFHLR